MPSLADLLPDLAVITTEAGQIAQDSRRSLTRKTKPDGSILTNGDQAVESFLRRKLTALIPGTNVWGEEFGFEEQSPEGLWLVDPIDGTSNYAFYSPLWGVSVGLLRDDRLELGAVYLADLGEMYLSARGQGVTRNGQPLPAIPPGPIEPYELVSFNDHILNLGAALPGKMRHDGAFVIDGCFVACQRFRGLIGIRERLYDVAACVLFGLELGAEVRYADGSPFDLRELKENVKIRKPWLIFPRDTGFLLPQSS